MRIPNKAGIAGIALATASLMIVTAPTASGEHQSGSSAYGASVGGSPGQPAVESDGSQEQKGGGQVPAQLGPLAAGGVLDLSAGNDHASAKITNLTLGQAAAQLPQELKDGIAKLSQACTVVEQGAPADQALAPLNDALNQVPGVGTVLDVPTIEAATVFCNGLLDADIVSLAKVGTLLTECNDQSGTVTLTDVEVLGAPQPALVGQVAPETQLLPEQLAAVAKITLNHQIRDGENFTVQGLRIEVGGKEVAVLASATCGAAVQHAVEVKSESVKKKPKSKPAPVPTPAQVSAPVTG
ncbi:MAG: hypothetical protein JWN68_2934 [Nocardioides sp.]|jgi:hypothetical protein|uniref:hypothetical protein n=1 Tax=Nocardioides sp. TaxID=35761 RepID=UPI00262C3BB1|nr:hypothetical protein [Nocardioides sp.]MCW2834981.1 hypothetical protein [Nocardioides sp.]